MAEKEQTQSGLDLAVKTGTAAKPIIANESVLAQMEQLYKDKLARSQSFLQDMADAQAWWSGGAEGPSRPLAERARTRAAQEKDLEELARGIATTKVGLGQLQEAGQALQPGGTSAPVMGGGAPTAGGTTLPQGWATIRGVPVPPEVAASYQAYLRVGDITRANAVLTEYAKTRGSFLNAPGTYEQKPFFDEQLGRTVQRTPLETQEQMLTGRQPAPAAVPAPAVTPAPATAPAPSAASQVSDVYRFENLSEPQQTRLRTEFTNLGLQGTVEDLFNRSPVEKRKAAFQASGETPVVSTPAAATTQAVVPKPRFGSKGEEDIYKKGQEEYVSGQQKKAGEAVGERRSNLENARTELNTRLAQANTIINILDSTPEAVGISFRNPTTGLIMKAAESGLIPFVGKKDLEEVMATQLPKEARINREKFDSIASNLSAEFRREAAKGTGQVSDYETKLFQKATGLEKSSPAEANRYFAVIAAENLRTKKQLLDSWEKQPKGADFAEWEKSAEYKQIQDQKVERLKKLFPETALDETGFGEKKKPSVVTKDEQAGWDQRYGRKSKP
jgi:hypothetical protein